MAPDIATVGTSHPPSDQVASGAVGSSRPEPVLQVQQLSKSYPSSNGPVRAIDGIDLEVHDGEFVSVVGPSGCGKSTLLNCISGLLEPTSGRVLAHGEVVAGGPPADMSIVFQDYSRSLFQWLSVERNIGLPLRRQKVPRGEVRAAVGRLLDAVGLPASVAGRYPWQLSGGMQQRVAIARSLISKPSILLMDEPFASVDAQTRMSLEDLVLQLWSSWNKSVLFVTHDIDEAVYLSDRIVVLAAGPSRVRATIEVPLPRPRAQIDTKRDERFGELRSRVLELVLTQPADEGGVS